jgi:hypothetical protein
MWMVMSLALATGTSGEDAPVASTATPSAVVDGAGPNDHHDPVADFLAEAEGRLDAGATTEAVGVLLAHVRAGELAVADRPRAAALFARAADLLAATDERKAAAVAGDAAAALDSAWNARSAGHLAAHAARLVASEPAAARGLAERALALHPETPAAVDVVADVAGTDTWVNGHLTLGAGVAMATLSATAFVVGFDIERQARGGIHTRDELDVLLLRRGIAAGVAWPMLVGAAVASAAGVALIVAHEPGPEGVLPSPFPTLPDEGSSP